jgi:small subunit ribosomal protein S3Ae
MVIKKTWFDITAPAMFGSAVVGQTPAAEPKLLVGRVLKMALPDLGVDSRKFFLKIGMRIDSVDGTKALTKFIGHECTAERIYRMVQRHARRVDCIQDVQVKDGKLRVKTVLIIPKRVGTAIKDAVRAKIKVIVSELVSAMTVEEFIQSVVNDKLQLAIKDACKKIYPIGMVEIRKSEVLA